MPISQFFDKTVDTYRLADTADTDNQAWVVNLNKTAQTGVKCNIQPLDDAYGEDLESSYGKDFVMFSEIADIKQGEKIVDGSVEYMVQGVEIYDWQGILSS